jgi:urease accessory protein
MAISIYLIVLLLTLCMLLVLYPLACKLDALSVLVLGILIAFAIRLPALMSVVLIALFALLHGYAHGSELAAAVSGISYGLVFLACTFSLHVLGLLVSLSVRANLKRALGHKVSKLIGTAIASCGLLFLYDFV